MSRPLVILVLVLAVLAGGAVLLSGMDTEVAPTRVEKPVADAQPAS